jgi:hypothetical protein
MLLSCSGIYDKLTFELALKLGGFKDSMFWTFRVLEFIGVRQLHLFV